MTADAIYDRVLALMFSGENEKGEMLNQFLATLNIHLLELFEKENGMREKPLKAPPVISDVAEKIDYSDRILAFLPFGIAGTMMAEDDPNIAVQYKNKYEEERAKCVVCKFVEVVNDEVQ
jgi:hypothetical protein